MALSDEGTGTAHADIVDALDFVAGHHPTQFRLNYEADARLMRHLADMCQKAKREIQALRAALRATAAPELAEAGASTDNLLRKAQGILTSFLEPKGEIRSEAEAVNELLALLDGPEQRDAQDALASALRAAGHPAYQGDD